MTPSLGAAVRTKALSSPVWLARQEGQRSSLPAPGNSDRQAQLMGRRQQAAGKGGSVPRQGKGFINLLMIGLMGFEVR